MPRFGSSQQYVRPVAAPDSVVSPGERVFSLRLAQPYISSFLSSKSRTER